MSAEFDYSAWPRTKDFVKTGQHYKKAPVVEAILEFKVDPSSDGPGLDALEGLLSDQGEYADVKRRVDIEGQVEVLEKDIAGAVSGEVVGYLISRSDMRRSISAELGRFAFSWRDHYSEWSDFLNEAEEMWLRYRAAVAPKSVLGVGVRFVNQILVPSSNVEFADYLRTYVDVSPYLPQAMTNVFMQVEIPLPDHKCISTIASAFTEPPSPDVTSIILDIDTRRTVNLHLNSPTFEQDLKQTMEALRSAKNFVFEACITDATRGLIR